MAPRKIVKHADSDVVDKVAEAGDISLPKRKKTATKSANKNDEEKPIPLPRAAKSAKVEQNETVNAAKTVKPISTSSTVKNASTKRNRKQAEVNAVTDLANTKSSKAKNANRSEVVTVKKKNQVNTEATAKVKIDKKKPQVDVIEQEDENMVAKTTNKPLRDTPIKQRLRPNSIRNKENSTMQKIPTKTRGKATQRNVIDELTEVAQEAQEKTATETVTTTKKGRGRKMAATKEENGDPEGKKTSNSTETIVNNNNVQKSLDDNDKKDNSEKQDTESLEMVKPSLADEINEDNVQSALIKEED